MNHPIAIPAQRGGGSAISCLTRRDAFPHSQLNILSVYHFPRDSTSARSFPRKRISRMNKTTSDFTPDTMYHPIRETVRNINARNLARRLSGREKSSMYTHKASFAANLLLVYSHFILEIPFCRSNEKQINIRKTHSPLRMIKADAASVSRSEKSVLSARGIPLAVNEFTRQKSPPSRRPETIRRERRPAPFSLPPPLADATIISR